MRVKTLFLLVVFMLLIISSLNVIGAQSELQNVKLQLRWSHQFQFAGYYAAISQGYYKDAGLNVTIIEGVAGISYIDEVVNGNAEFGTGGSDILYENIIGKPIVALGTIFQHNPYILITLEKSNINSPEDLIGKKVMMRGADAPLSGLLYSIQINDKIEYVEHTWNNFDLVNKNVDAISGYKTDRPFWFQSNNISINTIEPIDYGIDFYGDTLFTTDEIILEDPLLVDAFRKASFKGWEYALENPDEMIDYIIEEYDVQIPRELLEFEAEMTSELMQVKFIEVGIMNIKRWENILETYIDIGMISPTSIPENFIFNQNTVDAIFQKYNKLNPPTLTEELSKFATSAVAETSFQESAIKDKAISVAQQMDIYIRLNPEMTLKELQSDEFFREIAIQDVGETGYTYSISYNDRIVYFHPQSSVENQSFDIFKETYPDIWEISYDTVKGETCQSTSGYYEWRDINEELRDKYAYHQCLSEKTADNVALYVGASTFLDEYVEESIEKETFQSLSIKLKSIELAHKIDNYLLENPESTLANLMDTLFIKSLASELVGETGYVAIFDTSTKTVLIHPQERFIGESIDIFKASLPKVWQILNNAISGTCAESGGYYEWEEEDGSLSHKYQHGTCTSIPTSDGKILSVFATTYLDEYRDELKVAIIDLTDEEKEWMKNNDRTIKYAPAPSYPPFEFFDKNRISQGIAVEYIEAIEDKLNFHFKRVELDSSADVLNKLETGEIDISGAMSSTPDRKEYLLFTDSYIEIPNVIIVNTKNTNNYDLNNIGNLKVLLTRGYAIEEMIQSQNISLNIEYVENDLEGLKKVSFGEADIYIGDLAVTSYIIDKFGITNLRIAGDTNHNDHLSIASRSDLPILGSILKKSLATLSQEQQREIRNEWIGLKVAKFNSEEYQNAESALRLKISSLKIKILNYLDDKGETSIIDLQNDPKFKEIVFEKIGETGYGVLNDPKTGEFKIHPNENLVDTSLESLKDISPSFWTLYLATQNYEEICGKYWWPEPDGTQKEKIMCSVKINIDEIPYSLVASAYVTEFESEDFENEIRSFDFTKLMLKEKTQDIAKDISDYLILHPDKTLGNLQQDNNFKKMVQRDVGLPGQIVIIDASSFRVAFSPFQFLENISILDNLFPEDANIEQKLDLLIENGDTYFFFNGFDINIHQGIEDINKERIPRYGYMMLVSEELPEGKKLAVLSTISLEDFISPESSKEIPRDLIIWTSAAFGGLIIITLFIVFWNYSLQSQVEHKTKSLLGKEKSLKKTNKRISELLKTKSDFLNQVAHDLRTPLTPIKVLLQIINRDKALKGRSKKNLKVVLKNVNSLSYLITNVLNLVRLERRGSTEVIPTMNNLKRVIQDALENISPILEENDIKATLKFDPAIPYLEFDANKIMQVLGNIFSNAIRHMDKTKPKIIINTKKIKYKIIISIQDNGQGIEYKNLQKVFREFFQVSQYQGGQSSGLGLSISKKIIELHNGKIWAESKGLGKGTTFNFSLPIKQPKNKQNNHNHKK